MGAMARPDKAALGQSPTQPTGSRLVRSPLKADAGNQYGQASYGRITDVPNLGFHAPHCVHGGIGLFSPPYFISADVADTQPGSAVAILRGKRRTMLVVQHRRQPVQGLVAKPFRLDRLHRRQHIVAVDAGLAVALQHMA